MPDWLLSRSTIITLAVAGGLVSLLGAWCKSQGKVSEQQLALINKIAHVFMMVSIVLFIGAGFFST